MKRKYFYLILSFPLVIFIIWGGIRLGENEHDPLWTDLETLISSNEFYYLEDAKDMLDSAFLQIQKDTSYYGTNAYDLINDPFPLTMEYRKFLKSLQFVYTNRMVLTIGVTGSGRSTLLDRLSKFIAVTPDRIISLSCVPKLEVEYHKQWVGYVDNGVFYKGKMLKFLERAHQDTIHNYVMIIDDIDLIYPSTFFGAALWNEMENPNYSNYIEGYEKEITIPENFFLITTTRSGPGSVIKLNDQHYRRLSPNGVLEVYPDSLEFMLYLKRKFSDSIPEYANSQIRKTLYTFIKINNEIEKDLGKGYTIGQWSSIRKSIREDEYSEYVNKFIQHVNSLNSEILFDESNVSDVIYSVNNNGIIRHSNVYAKVYTFVYESGIFSEASVAIVFLILSSFFGYLFYVRRRNIIRGYVMKVYKVSEDFDSNLIDYQKTIDIMYEIKHEVDHLAMRKKINYTESLFIYNLIRDRSDIASQSNETEEMYNKMLNVFMEDDIISEKEYKRLERLIERSKNRISESYYLELIKRLKEINQNK